MSSVDHTLLVILVVLMSVFFTLLITLTIFSLQLTASLKRIVLRAEEVADSVEVAAEALRDTTTKMSFIKLLNSIINMNKKAK
jgi:hypothetical protein